MEVWPTLDDTVMDTSFETNNTNPFQLNNAQPQTNGSETSYQKANLLLDLAGGENYKHSASSPSETDLYFLNRPANGKGAANYDDDDFGPETDVDAVDDVLLSPAIAAAKAAVAAAAAAVSVASAECPDKNQLEADLELQRQQLSAFDPVREPREETPTPPADDVTGGTALLPEAENVAESGEESEDEWNYYRVEPTDKSAKPAPPSKSAEETLEEDEASMESRLNPNAAEFVPSPTSTKPSMEELLSESPRKGGVVMDNVSIPSPVEFQQEASLRPSELDLDPFGQAEVSVDLLPDLLNGKTELDSNEKNPYQLLENESDLGEYTEQMNPFKSSDHLFDKSEVSSTKAEFGDDTSFLGNMSDGDYLLKAGDSNMSSNVMDLDASMTESDFMAANLSQEMISKELATAEDTFVSTVLSDEQTTFFKSDKDFMSPSQHEVDQMFPVNDICLEVNSKPLNEELGLGDNVIPVNMDFVQEFANPPQESVLDLASPMLHDDHISSGALSPNKDTFDLVMDITEELLAPTLSSPPPPSNIPVSAVTSEFENLVTETITSDLAQLEIDLSPVGDDIISDVSNFAQYETQMPPSNQVTESLIFEENNLPLLSPSQEIEVKDELLKEAMEDWQSKEYSKEVTEELLSNVPAHIIEEVIKPIIPAVEEDQHQETRIEDSSLPQPEKVAVAALAASVVTAVAAGVALSGNETNTKETKPAAKKLVDKAKVPTKTTPGVKSAVAVPQKTASKTTPTSPTKPLASTPRSAPAIKKPTPTATSRLTNKVAATTLGTGPTKVTATSKPTLTSTTSKVTASSTSQVRVKIGSSSPTKSASPVKLIPTKTTAPSRPRPATTATAKAPVAEKKPGLTNGDAKPIARRPEPNPAAKRLGATTASKPLARPASAPAASKTTKSSTVSRTTTTTSVSSKPAVKPAVNGVAKPKTTTITSVRSKPLAAVPKPGTVDKQVKDTANKQISSVNAKSSTTRTATATTTRKAVGGVTKTTTTTTVTKSSSGPIRRPPGTTITKTTTSQIITDEPTEKEMVVVKEFTTIITKDDSPVIDNAQIEVISSTD